MFLWFARHRCYYRFREPDDPVGDAGEVEN